MVKQTYKYGVLNYSNEENRKKFFCLKNIEKDEYQEYVNDTVKKYGKNNTLILDVGANVGIFTISFAKLFPNSEIHSFECVPSTKNYLEMNVKENNCNNVVIHDYGLSDKNEQSDITFNEYNTGNASIKLKATKDDQRIKIELKKLDDLNLTNISFIKADIQDHELEFIKGAENTLKNNDCFVILELTNKKPYEKLMYKECVKFMKSIGYKNVFQICRKDWGFSKN